ncbi:MAG TPA: ribonuclease III [Acidobacteriaceae bacterium]
MESSPQSPGTSIDRPRSLDAPPPDPSAPGFSTVDELEAVLDHHFAKPALLERALTHSSLAHERGADDPQRQDNETLEFLGDAVVGLVAAEYVYRCYPELSEGALTRLRGALVSRRHLAEVAQGLHLGKYLLLGRGEERSGGRMKTALLANTMESLIGAVYLDAGLATVRAFIEARVIAPVVGGLRAQLTASGGMGDFKSALQELLQARRQGQPDYRITGETGPDHRKRFFVEVRVGAEALAEGEGHTRKHAEQDAARRAVDKLQASNPGDPE